MSAKKEASAEKYSIFGQSCIDVVQAALEGLVNQRFGKDFADKLNLGSDQLVPMNLAFLLDNNICNLSGNTNCVGDDLIDKANKQIGELGDSQKLERISGKTESE